MYLQHLLLAVTSSYKFNTDFALYFSSTEEIIQMIVDGNHELFGAEKLKELLKLLPEQDEVDMLKSFDGDKTKLGVAEKFILQLIEVPK